MKKTIKNIISIMIIAMLLLIAGCGNSSSGDSSMPVDNTDNVQNTDSDNTNSDDTDISAPTEKTMKHCYTYDKSAPVQYKFYITDEKIYEKTSVPQSGDIENVVTKTQMCIKNQDTVAAGLNWNCIDTGAENFAEHIEGADALTTGNMATAMKIKCENIAVDDTVFNME